MNNALWQDYALRWDRDTGLGVSQRGAAAGDLKVRMWPKAFVYRPLRSMEESKAVFKKPAGAAADVAAAGDTCLGQQMMASDSATPGTRASAVDFTQPFIVAPVADQRGGSKVDMWLKFQRDCFVLNPVLRTVALPEKPTAAMVEDLVRKGILNPTVLEDIKSLAPP